MKWADYDHFRMKCQKTGKLYERASPKFLLTFLSWSVVLKKEFHMKVLAASGVEVGDCYLAVRERSSVVFKPSNSGWTQTCLLGCCPPVLTILGRFRSPKHRKWTGFSSQPKPMFLGSCSRGTDKCYAGCQQLMHFAAPRYIQEGSRGTTDCWQEETQSRKKACWHPPAHCLTTVHMWENVYIYAHSFMYVCMDREVMLIRFTSRTDSRHTWTSDCMHG